MSERTTEPGTLEPADVGPIVGGNLRASDADREQVATVLSAAYAEGRITIDEHDERLDRVMAAKTFDQLIPITQDLVPISSPAPTRTAPVPVGSSGFTIDTAAANADSDKMIAVFGGVTRTGRWRIRKNTQALALFGGMELDLRDAVFESQVVEISGFWCFGGLEIKVPAGIEVRDQTAGIFGGTEVRDVGDPLPGAPTLVLKGMTLFGRSFGTRSEAGQEAAPRARVRRQMTTMSLRASDADRDQVTTLLHAAYAEGRITDDELDTRTESALQARTFDDLYAVTADLVPMVTPASSVPDLAPGQPDNVVAIVSDTKRVGPWRVRPQINVRTIVGEVELDLTEAIFDTPVVEISCAVYVGEVKIRVRPGTNVRMLATGIIGETSVKNIGPADPSMPTVVIRGTAVVGEISVRGPKRPPFWRRRVA